MVQFATRSPKTRAIEIQTAGRYPSPPQALPGGEPGEFLFRTLEKKLIQNGFEKGGNNPLSPQFHRQPAAAHGVLPHAMAGPVAHSHLIIQIPDFGESVQKGIDDIGGVSPRPQFAPEFGAGVGSMGQHPDRGGFHPLRGRFGCPAFL